jgi:7,8-dihydropterin-6-yl-methyl-4-(beta-D-ribofuranosyl)aminobenzene 5'-phosphate synthase
MVRTVVLSHGHYDHTGGLLDVLSRTGPVDVIAHPGIFVERYWVGEHEQRAIGIPFARARLESLGAHFHLHLMAAGSDDLLVPDSFPDDASLIIETAKGLVLLVGCAHAGLVNTLQMVREQTGCPHLYAVLGGTHLAPASDEQFTGTVRALRAFGVERIGVSHCTGLPRAAQLYAEFGGRFFFASVGTTLEF